MLGSIVPFGRVNSLMDMMDSDFFGDRRSYAVNMCKTDIRETDDAFIVEAELPGFNKEDITLDIVNNNVKSLVVKAERKQENEEEKGNYICRERSYSSYQRSFALENVDDTKIEAGYENGILTLTLPKKKEEVPVTRRLQIK